MATIDPAGVVLYDQWAGTPSPGLAVPEGGDFGFFNGSRHHSQASEIYRIGEKVRVYNDPGTGAGLGIKGWSTMIYMQVDVQDTGTAISAGSWVTLDAATVAANKAYTVTNDPDSALEATGATIDQLPGAVAIGAVANTHFGWFWCGGVAPLNWLLTSATASLLSSTSLPTDGSLDVGDAFTLFTSGGIVKVKKAIDVNDTTSNMIVGTALVIDA